MSVVALVLPWDAVHNRGLRRRTVSVCLSVVWYSRVERPGLMQRLQAVQNAAARLVTGTRRRDHITPVLRQLHWFPVRQRVNFKLAVLVFKAYNWSPMLAAATSARQKPLHVYFNVPTPASATERLEFLDHLCGTASPPNSASLISLGQFRRALKTFLF